MQLFISFNDMFIFVSEHEKNSKFYTVLQNFKRLIRYFVLKKLTTKI